MANVDEVAIHWSWLDGLGGHASPGDRNPNRATSEKHATATRAAGVEQQGAA